MSRLDRLDELLAAPTELPPGLEERLRRIPDAARPARSWLVAAAAAVVLAAGVLGLHRSSHAPTPKAPEAAPRRSDRVVVALRHPSPGGRAFLEAEGARILVTLQRLARDRDAAIAVPAIERLGELADRASLPALRDAAGHPDRCDAAMGALARIGDPVAVPAIAPWLDDPAHHVAARDALVAVGGRRAAEALLASVAVAVAVADADAADAVADHARGLVEAAGRLGDPAATRGLLDLLDRPPLEAALRKVLADGRHRLALLELARDRDPARARAAIDLLAAQRASEAVPVFRSLLADGACREAAARALAAIDTPEAGAALLDGLGARGVREAFADAGPGIETWLLARIAEGDRRERRRAVGLLALCGRDACVPVLAALADDAALAPDVVRALGGVGSARAVAALEALAGRTSLRRPVIDALAATASVDAVPALTRLGTTDRRMRRLAIAALGCIPHADAVRAILALDGRADTRRTTARALGAMDPDTVLPTLVALLDGEHASEARRWLDAVGP